MKIKENPSIEKIFKSFYNLKEMGLQTSKPYFVHYESQNVKHAMNDCHLNYSKYETKALSVEDILNGDDFCSNCSSGIISINNEPISNLRQMIESFFEAYALFNSALDDFKAHKGVTQLRKILESEDAIFVNERHSAFNSLFNLGPEKPEDDFFFEVKNHYKEKVKKSFEAVVSFFKTKEALDIIVNKSEELILEHLDEIFKSVTVTSSETSKHFENFKESKIEDIRNTLPFQLVPTKKIPGHIRYHLLNILCQAYTRCNFKESSDLTVFPSVTLEALNYAQTLSLDETSLVSFKNLTVNEFESIEVFFKTTENLTEAYNITLTV